jgi:hypothetical protein
MLKGLVIVLGFAATVGVAVGLHALWGVEPNSAISIAIAFAFCLLLIAMIWVAPHLGRLSTHGCPLVYCAAYGLCLRFLGLSLVATWIAFFVGLAAAVIWLCVLSLLNTSSTKNNDLLPSKNNDLPPSKNNHLSPTKNNDLPPSKNNDLPPSKNNDLSPSKIEEVLLPETSAV